MAVVVVVIMVVRVIMCVVMVMAIQCQGTLTAEAKEGAVFRRF